MDSVVLGTQVLLAVVFATAGVAKLLDQPGSRSALEGFGVPAPVVPVAGFLLPIAELATAAALVPHPTARAGAIAALLLLLAFIGGIARAMSRGEAPDCHCFGQLQSAPAGRGTLARNAVLAVLAGLVVVHGAGPAIDDWVSARTGAELIAVGIGILAAVLAGTSARLWLQNRDLRTDLEGEREAAAVFPPGLPVGAAAPEFTLPDVHGQTHTLESLLERGRPLALVFASPGCGPCASLLPQLGRWEASLTNRLTIGVISTGPAEANLPLEEYGMSHVLLQEGIEVMEAYRLRATPSMVIVGRDMRIASPAAVGEPAVEPLIRLALRNGTGAATGVRPPRANGARREQQLLSVWQSA